MNERQDIRYLSVSALNKYLAYKFEIDRNLKDVYVKAEISNCRLSKGIYYFVLKDSESEISAIMYESYANRLNFKIEDGMTVLVCGKVSVYAKRGTYSINVSQMDAVGLGEAYLKFIELRDKLSKEGLFDDQYKREIPRFNHIIGLITSETGDARHDVEQTVMKRYPLSKVILYKSLVQGEDAPASLINALNDAINDAKCDCIIIARGGGSIEDLSCFNDEGLARAIFDSPIPIISGVGHEQDYTICDFVSDLRAPTPTGAAVLATPSSIDLVNEIDSIEDSISRIVKNKIDSYDKNLDYLTNSYVFKNFGSLIDSRIDKVNDVLNHLITLSPKNKMQVYLNTVSDYNERLNNSYNYILEKTEIKLDNIIDKLILVNPLNIMEKGYSITKVNGKSVQSINDVNEDDILETLVKDGIIESKVTKKKLK